MSDEFDDEILLEEDDGGSNRPFLTAAGALIGIMLLAFACLAIFNVIGGNGGEETAGEEGTAVAQVDDGSAATATSISATNEAIATANGFVTQTIESITLTAGAPTNTPTNTPVPPTNTPTVTPSPTPTETPVVDGAEDTNEDGDGTEEVNTEATSIFGGLNTATPSTGGGSGGSSGGSGSGGSSGGSGSGTLPETGISLWGGLAAVLGLLLLIVVVRRARAD